MRESFVVYLSITAAASADIAASAAARLGAFDVGAIGAAEETSGTLGAAELNASFPAVARVFTMIV